MPLCTKLLNQIKHKTQQVYTSNSRTQPIVEGPSHNHSRILETLFNISSSSGSVIETKQEGQAFDPRMTIRPKWLITDYDKDIHDGQTNTWIVSEFQMIKAVVLVVVLSILLLSTCKLIFKTFARNVEEKEQ